MKAPSCILLALFAATVSLDAQTYTWDGGGTTGGTPNNSGIWSTATNWSSDVVPGAGNTAVLGNVTAGDANGGTTRIITYDTAAPATLGGLQFVQTTAGQTNELAVQLGGLSIASDVTVAATAGSSLLYLNSSTGFSALSLSNTTKSLTIGSGGTLDVSNQGAGGSNVTANVTIAGGNLNEERGQASGSNPETITGNLSISGGTITIGTTPLTGTAVSTDNRLTITGNFSSTGGSIVNGNGGSINLSGATNDLSGLSSFATTLGTTLINGTSGAAQSLTLGTVNIGALTVRGANAGGSSVKTVSSGGGTVSSIVLLQANAGQTTSLVLGSNLKTSGTGAVVSAATFSQGNSTNLTVDTGTAGYTLDATSSTAGVVLNQQSGTATANWSLQGNGTIKAATFDLSAPASVGVSGNVTLQATGNAVTTNLSNVGSRTIAATSTFLYTGTGASTLNATRAIGNLTVSNTSGALTFNGTVGVAGTTTVNTGGMLTLSSTAAPLTGSPSIVLNAGGTLSTAAQATFTLASTQPITFGINPAGAGSAGLLAAAGLNITNGSVNFTTTGTLDDPSYILATYSAGALTGAQFATIANLPANYSLNYNYLGGNDIALVATAVPEPSTACISALMVLVFAAAYLRRVRSSRA